MHFLIKDTQLPKRVEVSGMVERVDIEHSDIKKIHDAFAQKRHGALVRRQLEWEEYFRWEVEDLIAAVYYNDNHPRFLQHRASASSSCLNTSPLAAQLSFSFEQKTGLPYLEIASSYGNPKS